MVFIWKIIIFSLSLLHIFYVVFKERDESFAFGVIMYVTTNIIPF